MQFLSDANVHFNNLTYWSNGDAEYSLLSKSKAKEVTDNFWVAEKLLLTYLSEE